MIVYKVTNIINNKMYVGMTTVNLKRRKSQHLYTCRSSGTAYLSKAIRDFGKDSFKFEEIDTAKTLDELIEKERVWIKKLNTLHPNGYNFLDGMELGSGLARNRCVAIRCRDLNKIFNSISEASLELNIDSSNIWYCCKGKTDAAGGLFFEYIDENKRNKAEEFRIKRKDKAKESFRVMGIKERKSIVCVNTGVIYDSVKKASSELSIDASQIVRVCKGKNKHAKGMVFKYSKNGG